MCALILPGMRRRHRKRGENQEKETLLVHCDTRADNPAITEMASQGVDLANDPGALVGEDFIQAIQTDEGLALLNRLRESLTRISFQSQVSGLLREIGWQIQA